jgi:DNA-binding MarR family transcriptional regulator
MTSPDDDAGAFDLAAFLPYRLSVATNRVSQALARRYADAYGLGIPDWRVLAVVGNFAPLSANAVCERTAMDKVKVSRAVARLMRRGLLLRATDPADRRTHVLSLSTAGRRVYGGIIPMARSIERTLTAALSDGERDALLTALAKLEACVAAMDGR